MVKITVNVEGMACQMCEAHINDTVRKAFPIKKVTSSHRKGMTEIVAEEAISESALREAIGATGYQVTGIKSEPFEKKGFHLFGRG